MSLIAYVNGEFLPIESATVHIEDRGFQFADGVYEVVACYDGRFFELNAHLQRLQRSCESIQLPLPFSLERMESIVRETYTLNNLDDAMVYIQVTRGVAPRIHMPAGALTPTLVVTVRPLPEVDEEKALFGAHAITLADIRWKRCDIKSIALLASVLAKQEAMHRGAHEAFWTNEQRHVLEGSSTNILAVINGTLTTHPQDHQILGGITRDLALRLAREHDIPTEERPWCLDEPGLSECMMSSTTNAVLPVVRIDDMPIADEQPGPVTKQLRELLLHEISAMCSS
ncbi:MAG TPA: D-amino acid aminotransferase [Mariprofundaceae bacterium]|nr:D-amino acid aminotransferase [Mariprofundaceae bacterium]